MSAALEALQVENEALRAKLQAWEGSRQVSGLRVGLRLSRSEALLLSLLMTKRRASRNHIYAAVFEKLNGDGPGLKIIDVFVCKVRAKLRAAGLAPVIRPIWGEGYEITPETVSAIEQRLAPQAVAA